MVMSFPLPARVAILLPILAAAAPVAARPGPAQTWLRHCKSGTCLVIEGHRDDPRATVRVAEHEVAVQGGRAFSVALPLDTVRTWSAPFARSITVRTEEPGGGTAERSMRLPVGLLGHVTELAALEVSAP